MFTVRVGESLRTVPTERIGQTDIREGHESIVVSPVVLVHHFPRPADASADLTIVGGIFTATERLMPRTPVNEEPERLTINLNLHDFSPFLQSEIIPPMDSV